MNERYLLYLPGSELRRWSEVLAALRAGQIRRSFRIAYRIAAHYRNIAQPRSRERILDGLFPVGISHNSFNLKILIQEAQYLGRTIVLAPLLVPSEHNLGRRVVSAIGEYYNLSRSQVRLADGREVVPQYIEYRDFIRSRDTPPFRSAKFFGPGEEIDRRTGERYPLIVRYVLPSTIFTGSWPLSSSLRSFIGETKVRLQVSEALSRMAEDTATALDSYCFLQWRAPWDPNVPFRVTGREPWDAQDRDVRAEAMRSGSDKLLRKQWSLSRHFVDGEGLCRQLVKIFPRGSKLYIAANLWRPHDEAYFGPLRALYRVYRCYDFPQLARLAEGPERNTAKLNLIENSIGEHAAHRLKVHPRNKDVLAEMQRIVDLPDPD